MQSRARKITLPSFLLTEVCEQSAPGAQKIELPDKKHYFLKAKLVPGESCRSDGEPLWKSHEFDRYPIVLNRDRSPWYEANLWILDELANKFNFTMSTYVGHAEDLAAYREWLEDRNADWLDFPALKPYKPTYRYRGHLKAEVETGTIQWSTARRRMATVIRFYRWLKNKNLVKFAHNPWEETDVYIPVKDHYGVEKTIAVKVTDVSIRIPFSDNPYSTLIEDGGKLRPLPHKEQEWLMQALAHFGNTEMTLIHLLSITTGARIQSVLTMRVRHVTSIHVKESDVIIRCGPQYGIDTKFNQNLVLFVPKWLYEKLHIYALSERALKRRQKAVGGNVDDQYLFLSEHSSPMYESKRDYEFAKSKKRRHRKTGQAVRMYMTKYLIPYIQQNFNQSFQYQFHDLRATYGMNVVDNLQPLLKAGKLTYLQLLYHVRDRMAHKSVATTELYLNYRDRKEVFESIQDDWEKRLRSLAELVTTAQLGE